MEKWLVIKEFEGKYFISNRGRVKTQTGKIKKLQDNRRGYYCCGFYYNGKAVMRKTHRLVAQEFLPNPKNKPQVNHKNGNKKDNNVENLEWVTQSENMTHAYEKMGCFEKRRANKHITDVQILEIFTLKGKMLQQEIAKMYNVNRSFVANIHAKRRYKKILQTGSMPSA